MAVPPSHRLKVTIADDDLLIAQTAGATPTEFGYQMCGMAHTVTDAVTLVRSHKPDLAGFKVLRVADVKPGRGSP